MVKEDMAEVTEEDTVDRNNWRRKIRCGDPGWEKPKEEEVIGKYMKEKQVKIEEAQDRKTFRMKN